MDTKSKFSKKEVVVVKKAIEFLFHQADVAEKEMDSVKKNAFEKHAVALSKMLYCNRVKRS